MSPVFTVNEQFALFNWQRWRRPAIKINNFLLRSILCIIKHGKHFTSRQTQETPRGAEARCPSWKAGGIVRIKRRWKEPHLEKFRLRETSPGFAYKLKKVTTTDMDTVNTRGFSLKAWSYSVIILFDGIIFSLHGKWLKTSFMRREYWIVLLELWFPLSLLLFIKSGIAHGRFSDFGRGSGWGMKRCFHSNVGFVPACPDWFYSSDTTSFL